ncbi:MAG: cyclase family protein, partial [Actinobacteria bacterium]|nr:cyclase family protein [Actinomycetota bacterium]
MENSWGRWGSEDEAGALNFVTPEILKKSLGLVRDGAILSLAQELGPNAAVAPHRRSPARFMDRDAGDYALGARAVGGFKFAEDTIQMATHSGTHVDALSHAWQGDLLYNGHSASEIRSTKGAQKCGADKLRPILTRGIFVDLVEFFGENLAPSFQISPDHFEKYYAAHQILPESGDAVLIRTGWAERGMDSHEYHENEPGITVEAAVWLAKHEIAIVGADNYAVEAQPSLSEINFPVHLCLLHRNGVPLIENLVLADLAHYARKTFLFVMAPLPLTG